MRRLIPLALLCASMYGQSYHWERVHRVKDCQYQGYDHGNLRIGGILHCKPDKYWSAWLLGAGLLPERFDSAKEARGYVENPVPLTATAAFPDHGLYIAHVREKRIPLILTADVPWPTCSQPWPKPQPPNCPQPPR